MSKLWQKLGPKMSKSAIFNIFFKLFRRVKIKTQKSNFLLLTSSTKLYYYFCLQNWPKIFKSAEPIWVSHIIWLISQNQEFEVLVFTTFSICLFSTSSAERVIFNLLLVNKSNWGSGFGDKNQWFQSSSLLRWVCWFKILLVLEFFVILMHVAPFFAEKF